MELKDWGWGGMSKQPEPGQSNRRKGPGVGGREKVSESAQPHRRFMESPSCGFNGVELGPENIQENSRMQITPSPREINNMHSGGGVLALEAPKTVCFPTR